MSGGRFRAPCRTSENAPLRNARGVSETRWSPGIWRDQDGQKGKVDLEVYAFLTTTRNKLMATIKHERMPVLLTREEEFDAWLNGAAHPAFAWASASVGIAVSHFMHFASPVRPASGDYRRHDIDN